MYDNLIVPFDGSLPARAALAPAADLAWRIGARLAIINNTEVSDQDSRAELKSRAMSMSGEDVDFWVDLDRPIAEAVVEAAKFRDNSLICLPIRYRQGVLRRKAVLTDTPAQVLIESPVPVMVIGPETDVSRGLSMNEIVIALDGSPTAETALGLAAKWAVALKARLTLLGVVPAGREENPDELAYLQRHIEKMAGRVPDTSAELVGASDPASGICTYLKDHDTAILVMSTHGRSGVDKHPLGSVAQAVLLSSPRAIVFQRAWGSAVGRRLRPGDRDSPGAET